VKEKKTGFSLIYINDGEEGYQCGKRVNRGKAGRGNVRKFFFAAADFAFLETKNLGAELLDDGTVYSDRGAKGWVGTGASVFSHSFERLRRKEGKRAKRVGGGKPRWLFSSKFDGRGGRGRTKTVDRLGEG